MSGQVAVALPATRPTAKPAGFANGFAGQLLLLRNICQESIGGIYIRDGIQPASDRVRLGDVRIFRRSANLAGYETNGWKWPAFMVGNSEKIGQHPEGELAKQHPNFHRAMRSFLKVGVCPVHDDVETREIGKLIDAGHPELATKAFRSKWRYRWLMRLASVIPFAAAAAWHLAR